MNYCYLSTRYELRLLANPKDLLYFDKRMKQVLIIPLDEIKAQFEENERQDVKIVSPKRLSDEVFELLKSKGKKIKREVPLQGDDHQ